MNIAGKIGDLKDRFPDLHADHPAAVVPRTRVLRDLPVPVDLERPAGGAGVPDRQFGQHDRDDQADRRVAGHTRRQLGNPRHGGLRVDRGSAGGVLRDAEVSGPRTPRGFGQVAEPQ